MPKKSWVYSFLTLVILSSAILSWVSFTCPRNTVRFRRSPLTITSKVANKSQPTVWLGLFGSCSRQNDTSPINCVNPVPHPFNIEREYDPSLSVLPSDAPLYVLEIPHWSLRVLAVFATSLQTVFVVLIAVITLIYYYLHLGGEIDKFVRQFQVWSVYIAILLLYFGITTTAVTHQYFEKTRRHFNAIVDYQGGPELDLVASVHQEYFYAIYAGFALLGIPLLAILMHLYGPAQEFANNCGDAIETAAGDTYRNVRTAATSFARGTARLARSISHPQNNT